MHKTIAATIGLMLYWPMLRGPYFQNLLFTPCPTGLDGREAYAIANILIVGLALSRCEEPANSHTMQYDQHAQASRFLPDSLAR